MTTLRLIPSCGQPGRWRLVDEASHLVASFDSFAAAARAQNAAAQAALELAAIVAAPPKRSGTAP